MAQFQHRLSLKSITVIGTSGLQLSFLLKEFKVPRMMSINHKQQIDILQDFIRMQVEQDTLEIRITNFPQSKLSIAQEFFSSYGGDYPQLSFKEEVLIVKFFYSEYRRPKEFTFERKKCFKKTAENAYTYQSSSSSWEKSEATLTDLNAKITAMENIIHRMYGRSLFSQCICGGTVISYEQMCNNNGDFSCTYVCHDCNRISYRGPETDGIQIQDEGK